MSVKERLIKYIDQKGITKTAFCLSIGVSTGFISSMRQSIQPDKVKSIALKYPDLNTGWLLTGEGEMLKYTQYTTGSVVKELREREENLIKLSGKINDRNISIPYYDIEISAGTVNFYKDYPELPHTTLEIPFVQGVDLAMPVYGDSMYPKIKNGDIVLLKEIHDKTVILYGEIYLVITEDYRTLKYIRKHPTSEEKILLVSENDRYDPVPMALNNVIHLFLYKGKFEKSQI